MNILSFSIRDMGATGWDRAASLLLALLAAVAAVTFRDYGNGFDALVQDTYGRQILAWYASMGVDRSALNYLDLYYYGGLFDTLAAMVNKVSPFGHWATRHLLEAVSGLIGLAGAWRLGRHLGGPRAGFLSLAALALMPSYYGMMFINPKDIPFAAAAIWAVWAITRIAETLPRPSPSAVIGFGLAAGAALGVRIGGVLVIGYLGAVLLVHLVATPREAGETWLGNAVALAVRVLIPALALAWAVMLAFWPWAQVAPLDHPWQALVHFANMHNDIDTLFLGHEVSRAYHPAIYLPVYLIAKLPDVVVVALISAPIIGLAAVKSCKAGLSLRMMPVLLAVVFPIAYAMLTRPELYDADRHFLFVLPPLAVLAGLAAERTLTASWGWRWAPAAVAVALVLGAGRQMQAMEALHPYEYAFFNDMVGGAKGAGGEFETEYWGTSLAEASTDLGRYLTSHGMARKRPWRVAVCGDSIQMGDQPHPGVETTTDWRHADFFVAGTRNACDRRIPGRVIAEVARDGAVFAIVKDVRVPKQVSRAAGRSPG